MIKLFFLLTFVFAVASPILAEACPLGAGEEKLTLSRVMRNFGRHLLPADRATQKGALDPSDVAEADLEAAIQGLSVAMSCAGITASDRSGSLYPRKASKLEGQARELYLTIFFKRMNEFLESLSNYRVIYVALLGMPLAERNFEMAKKQMREVSIRAERAHEDLE